MASRRDADPSPLRTGLTHAAMSLLVFGGVGASLGAAIHYSGNPADSGPSEVLALFETSQGSTAALKSRLKAETPQDLGARVVLAKDDAVSDQPSLGVEYAEASAPRPSEVPTGQGDEESSVEGIRINGKLVRPGESYGEVTRVASLDTAPVPGLTERINGLSLPRISADGQAPSDVYARPFANPGNQPIVAVVIGGLGINATHTKAAIEELPPEVTLSFAPDAGNLQYWVNKAREKGHEVLIEVPMESFEYGRMKMHPQTLLAGDTGERNLPRLEKLLSRASGYFGIINYQGAKFAEDPGAVGPVLQALHDRGIALVEDGSFQTGAFDRAAGRTQMKFARAAATIDAKLTADDIRTELLGLETLAKENGASMGTGYAFPLTIEIAKDWTKDMQKRGVVLAPASALISVSAKTSQPKRVQTGSLSQAPVNPEG
ncbi:divergent polysaccharide deacetylase family protein [Hyphomonas sp. UBA4494]|uniref:divergent polysaccharide deacetylase family protein n=1 Tax=Hyphomonas sp. UBA4494 TaxID=1946631 RepID=UPI0025BBB9AF|nr:divergent polysaccharide deacetylase family protein [Hyphomonas sp. UBA4494]